MQLLSGHLEDEILAILLKRGPLRTTELQDELFSARPCTRQGFYRALRKLKSEERVVVYKSQVSVSELWLRRMRHLLSASPGAASIVGDFSRLKPGEKLSLKLKGLSAMDQLWSHLFSVIEQQVPLRHPLFLYNPHNWSALLRAETDRTHEGVLKTRKRQAYLVIGSASELDKQATRAVGFAHVEVHFDSRLKQESYLAAIGEYVIEVQFAPKTRGAIHHVFKTAGGLEGARLQLAKLDAGAISKIIIERDKAKAARYARRFARDFYIPKRYRP